MQSMRVLAQKDICLSGEHQSQEIGGEGGEEEEMTEDEWSRRVAELKAVQVAMSVIYYFL